MLKNGSQQSTKQPTIMPIVLAAFVSILNFRTLNISFTIVLLDCGNMRPGTWCFSWWRMFLLQSASSRLLHHSPRNSDDSLTCLCWRVVEMRWCHCCPGVPMISDWMPSSFLILTWRTGDWRLRGDFSSCSCHEMFSLSEFLDQRSTWQDHVEYTRIWQVEHVSRPRDHFRWGDRCWLRCRDDTAGDWRQSRCCCTATEILCHSSAPDCSWRWRNCRDQVWKYLTENIWWSETVLPPTCHSHPLSHSEQSHSDGVSSPVFSLWNTNDQIFNGNSIFTRQRTDAREGDL